ncbi:MAG: hypothetical protein IJ874_09345 [Ruminococcus sp.]|nr:hypothetical protein [Ruminococcus sp.]
MLLSEFTTITGVAPTAEEYEEIEKEYYDFDGDKHLFCDSWVENGGMYKLLNERYRRISQLTEELDAKDKQIVKMKQAVSTEKNQIIGNGCSYIIYLTHNHSVSFAIAELLGQLKRYEYWNWSCGRVICDCRIPSIYHNQGLYYAMAEHNNGDWNITPTYELHILD